MKCPQHGQMNGTKEMRKYLQTFSGSKAAISATVGNTITTTTRQARAGNSIGRSTQTLFSCELIMTSSASRGVALQCRSPLAKLRTRGEEGGKSNLIRARQYQY